MRQRRAARVGLSRSPRETWSRRWRTHTEWKRARPMTAVMVIATNEHIGSAHTVIIGSHSVLWRVADNWRNRHDCPNSFFCSLTSQSQAEP